MGIIRRLEAAAFVLLSTIAEKQPHKQLYEWVPLVLSASRVIIFLLLWVWARIGIGAVGKGVPGWPYWTFGAILSIALPLTNALQKVSPEKVLDFAQHVYGRLGVGEGQGDVFEPHEWAHGDPHEGLL